MREAWGNMGIVHFQWWFFGACGQCVSKGLLDCLLCMCSCCIPIFPLHRRCFLTYFAGFYFPIQRGVPLVLFLCVFAGCVPLLGVWYIPSSDWYSCSVSVCCGDMSCNSCSPPRSNVVAAYCACPFVFVYRVSDLPIPGSDVVFGTPHPAMVRRLVLPFILCCRASWLLR